jgi:hypothetical protein
MILGLLSARGLPDCWCHPDLPAGGRIGDFMIITKRDLVRQSTRHAVPIAE